MAKALVDDDVIGMHRDDVKLNNVYMKRCTDVGVDLLEVLYWMV